MAINSLKDNFLNDNNEYIWKNYQVLVSFSIFDIDDHDPEFWSWEHLVHVWHESIDQRSVWIGFANVLIHTLIRYKVCVGQAVTNLFQCELRKIHIVVLFQTWIGISHKNFIVVGRLLNYKIQPWAYASKFPDLDQFFK